MSDRVFLDTNVLVYAYDQHDLNKQAKAQDLLTSGMTTESAVLSSQVLGEFFVVVTRKIKDPVSAEDAQRIIELLSMFPVVDIDVTLVKRAIETLTRYGISYWDALIVAAAERAGCSKILSEDLANGQTYNEVLIEDPFKF